MSIFHVFKPQGDAFLKAKAQFYQRFNCVFKYHVFINCVLKSFFQTARFKTSKSNEHLGVLSASFHLALSFSHYAELILFYTVLNKYYLSWQNGLDTKVEKSRKQLKERKNRAKKIRGVKKVMKPPMKFNYVIISLSLSLSLSLSVIGLCHLLQLPSPTIVAMFHMCRPRLVMLPRAGRRSEIVKILCHLFSNALAGFLEDVYSFLSYNFKLLTSFLRCNLEDFYS
jgi:hypothetical protein